ncbi:MAG: RNA polymerase sigma factor, partial [Actinomycetota bacterium]
MSVAADALIAGEAVELADALSAVYPWARGFARMLTRHEAEAEDLVQDAFMQAVRTPPEPATPEVLKAWLRTVMPRLSARRGRRAARELA